MSRCLAARPLPPQAYLMECFDYSPTSGELIWRTRPLAHFKNAHGMNMFNAKYAGTVAGNLTKRGYRTVPIEGMSRLLHRVVWKFVTGLEPPPLLDHRDTDKSNNRFPNLRPATKRQNAANSGASSVSATGIKGVHWDKDRSKFAVFITKGGRSTFIGRFDSADAASQAYQSEAFKLHGEYAYQPGGNS